eukprot:6838709-Ditylum_brightwellii.AAC.1
MKKTEDLMKTNKEIEEWQNQFDERLKQRLKKQEEADKNQLDRYNEKIQTTLQSKKQRWTTDSKRWKHC